MAQPLDPELYRDVASRYASGVVVVTTQADGFDHAMTATSFTSVSIDPMQVLFCVEKGTRFHDTMAEKGMGATWAVSILPDSMRPTASWFATPGRPLVAQFDLHPHTRAELTGNIVFDGALAVIEARTIVEYDAGDHTIIVGEVLSLEDRTPNLDLDDPQPDQRPLLYWARRYRQLG